MGHAAMRRHHEEVGWQGLIEHARTARKRARSGFAGVVGRRIKRGNLKQHAAGKSAGRVFCSEDWEDQWLRY